MTGLTLLTGGPASGKTRRLIDLVAARYRQDAFAQTLVLVPTARHADQFRQRLMGATPVAFGLDVTTLGMFAARLTAEAGIAPREVASELLARVVHARVASGGAAARFRPIAGTQGLHRLVAAAIADLIADGIEPAALLEAAERADSLDLLALADIYGAYLEELSRRGWHDPAAGASLAADAVATAAAPPLVVVDGTQFLTAGEVALVAALAQRAEV